MFTGRLFSAGLYVLYTYELAAPCREGPWEDFILATPALQLRRGKALSLTTRGAVRPRRPESRTRAVHDCAQKTLEHRGGAPTPAWGWGCSSFLCSGGRQLGAGGSPFQRRATGRSANVFLIHKTQN